MIKTKWEYFTKNIGSSNCLAVLKKTDGTPILSVYEGRKCHSSTSSKEFYFIQTCFASYDFEEKIITSSYDVNNMSEQEYKEKCLEIGCHEIEIKFRKQLAKISKIIS